MLIAIIVIPVVLFCTKRSEAVLLETQDQSPQNIEIDLALRQRLDSFAQNQPYEGQLSICVWDATAGKEVYSLRANQLLAPASNMKMLTVIAALRRLGPNYCFSSGFYSRGEVKGDSLCGDLFFRVGFDQTFNTDSLRELCQAVGRRGIRKVKGRVVLSMPYNDPMNHEQHWTMGDLKVRKLGIQLRGERRMQQEMQYALSAQNISYREIIVTRHDVPGDAVMISESNTPITAAIEPALLNSSNINADLLLVPMAQPFMNVKKVATEEQTMADCYRQKGTECLRQFILGQMHAVPDSVCRLHDGNGLCHYDRLTARFLVQLLSFARSHPYIWHCLETYLPVSGETGTLHDRMLRPTVRGKIHAKTGTLTRDDGITSLSGYCQGSNGHTLLFAIIQNGYPVADARLWQNKFCEKLVK